MIVSGIISTYGIMIPIIVVAILYATVPAIDFKFAIYLWVGIVVIVSIILAYALRNPLPFDRQYLMNYMRREFSDK